MMKFSKQLAVGLTTILLMAALSACQKQEGPVEQAGKKVDEAAKKTGEQIEKAGDKIQDAANGDKK